MAVNLKVKYEGLCVKRFKLDDVTFQSLREALHKHAPAGMVCEEVSYTDSDGDVVQVGSQLEFEECLRLCAPGGALVLLCKVSPPKDLSSKGLIEIEQGHYDVAVQTFSQAVGACPDEAALQYSLACALALDGRAGEAVQALRQASLKMAITCPEVAADWGFGSDEQTSESEAEAPLKPEEMDQEPEAQAEEAAAEEEGGHWATGDHWAAADREPEPEQEPEEAQAPAEQVDPSAAAQNILGGILGAFQGLLQGISGRDPVNEADMGRLRNMGFTDEEAMKRALSRARGDLRRAVLRLLSEVIAVHPPEQPEQSEQQSEQPQPLPEPEEQDQQQSESQSEQPQQPQLPEQLKMQTCRTDADMQAEQDPEQNQPTAMEELKGMGFPEERIMCALTRARGDVQRAVHVLLSYP